MSLKDEFLKSLVGQQKDGKIRFALDDHGDITHLIKRVDPRCREVYEKLAALRSPYLPAVLLMKEVDGALEVHEEYIRGQTLEAYAQEQGPLDDETLRQVAFDVAQALRLLHSTQPPIIHRDVKPQNILRRENGRFVLIDFDAARLYDADADTDTRCIVTMGYAAPEQYGLAQTDVRSDLFSLGVTLYEMKTGEHYVMGAKCEGALHAVIARCTAFDPKKRYASAEELLRALDAQTPAGKKRRLRRGVGAGAMALLLAGAWLCPSPMIQTVEPNALPSSATPAPSPMLAATAPSAAALPCTCLLRSARLSTPDGSTVLPFNGEPLTLALHVEGNFDSGHCSAENHDREASLRGAKLLHRSAGAQAVLSDGNVLTIQSPGVYLIDSLISYHDQTIGPEQLLLVATEHSSAYQDCKCLWSWKDTRPTFDSNLTLPTDGSPLRVTFGLEPGYDRRLCTAEEHLEVHPLYAEISQRPEGSAATVENDLDMLFDVPGTYNVRLNLEYAGVLESVSYEVVISES